jgi:RNA polymerase sigma-70 factor, ECF subfamily
VDSTQAAKEWKDLVWPYLAAVLRVARILCGNAADAEDLAQETMLKSFRAFERLADRSGIKAWLMAILRNTWVDRLRLASSSETVVSLEDDLIEARETSPDQEPHWQELADNPDEVLNRFGDQEIIDALRLLPVELRWTLLLVDVEGVDQQEAAQILGVPVGTIKSRAHRGRAMLRKTLLPVAWERRLIRD